MSTTAQATRPSPAALRQAALITARENLAYWKSKRAQAYTPVLRAEAGARVLAWQMQIQRLNQR